VASAATPACMPRFFLLEEPRKDAAQGAPTVNKKSLKKLRRRPSKRSAKKGPRLNNVVPRATSR